MYVNMADPATFVNPVYYGTRGYMYHIMLWERASLAGQPLHTRG